jgi:hypothetical protein
MNSPKIVLRVNAANPNHHLYNNNGTWWCHYTEHRPDFTKQRIRASLGTKDLSQARARRDWLVRQNAIFGSVSTRSHRCVSDVQRSSQVSYHDCRPHTIS